MEYIFELGSFPYLSLSEIINVLESEELKYNVIEIDIEAKELHIEIENISPKVLMDILGGTRSIYSVEEKKKYKQRVSDYKKREFGKPFVDSKSGLLPSKLAKMIINLSFTKNGVKKIYDPFTGGGTIISEAAVMGIKGIGSDIDLSTINQAKGNLKWLISEYNLPKDIASFFQCDVRNIRSQDEKLKGIDAIVSEPYMGNAVSSPLKMGSRDIFNLNKVNTLIEEAIKSASSILKTGYRMVIIIPQFKTIKGMYTLPIREKFNRYSFGKVNILKDLDIDKCPDLLYFRPKAIVQREIFILEKI